VPQFVPGVDLARDFYSEWVQPLLSDGRRPVPHAAALIGPGSEVLGFDTERSTDHHWGPRVLVFLDAPTLAEQASRFEAALAKHLPTRFRGWSTNWSAADGVGVQQLVDVADGPVAHRVEFHEPGAWFRGVVGFDPAEGVTIDDWLATPTQLLLAATTGAVFHDDTGALESRRAALAWYPRDVWLHLIGCQWRRVAQEESFVGRAGEVHDDLGSRVVAARVARDLMRLCFLLERRHAPYSKWLGRAFETLPCAPDVGPHLLQALRATGWQRREAELGAAAEKVAELHNRLGITDPVDASVRPLHGRPFLVLDAQRFADVSFAAIADVAVASLPRGVGAVDQWVDSTDVLTAPRRTRLAHTALHRGP
jgi:hypothetical protein